MTDQTSASGERRIWHAVIEFPTPEAPKNLKVVELTEGGPSCVGTVTVNYHGVVVG